MEKHKLSNCGANIYMAFHLGGKQEDYQVNEDNVVFYQGKRIGRWEGHVEDNLEERKISIKHCFLPDAKLEYITLDFTQSTLKESEK